MAKRDINEIESVDAEQTVPVVQEKPLDIYVVKHGPAQGLRIKLASVDPLMIKKSQDAVKLPKRPTYQAQTVSGKKEEFPLDEESAKQVPNGIPRWLAYLEARNEAFSERNDRLVQTTFYYGTSLLDPLPDGWEEEQLALGVEIPSHENPKINEGLVRSHYLATHLNQTELADVIQGIMRLSGVSEEAIQEAEATFRG